MSDRARQFMPFAALKGYYELLAVQERVSEERRELSEAELDELSWQVSRLKRGDVCTVVHYKNDAYEQLTGAVTAVDVLGQQLRIVKETIAFANILKIEIK